MKCPYCSHSESKVVDKRETGSKQEITRRRRECLNCSKRFTTYETVENVELIVIKKDDRRELFDRNKLFSGIMRACEKRPITKEQVDELIVAIKADIINQGHSEIKSSEIGEFIMVRLRKLDKVAYIRFASVYRDFTDVNEFEEELRKLLRKD